MDYDDQDDRDEVFRDCIKKDGGLYSLGWYLSWRIDDRTACLDGTFTAADLEAIASHMRKHQVGRR